MLVGCKGCNISNIGHLKRYHTMYYFNLMTKTGVRKFKIECSLEFARELNEITIYPDWLKGKYIGPCFTVFI